jgi:hypothetical protein
MWPLLAITLILALLFFVAKQLSAPSLTVLIDGVGKTTVAIVPSNLESRRRILFLLAYISTLRARLPDELPGEAEVVAKFDDFIAQILELWECICDGSALDSALSRELAEARIERSFARYHATLDMSGGLPFTASAINRPCDLATVELHLLALMIAITQGMPDTHQVALRTALATWLNNRDGLPSGRQNPLSQVRAAQHCFRCFELSLKAVGLSEAEMSAGAPPVNWTYVLTRWALLVGYAVRIFSFLVYPLLWMLGVHEPLPLVSYCILLHVACHFVGGIGTSTGLGTQEPGEYSRSNIIANHMGSDASRYMSFAPLAGLAVAIASWITFEELSNAFGTFVVATGACLAFGWLVLSLAKVIKASTLRQQWHRRRSQSVGGYPTQFPLPALPFVNLLLSNVHLTFFLIFATTFSLLGLIVGSIFPLKGLFDLGSPLWPKIVFIIASAVVLALGKEVNSRLVQRVLVLCKSQIRILILRRFQDWASKAVRTIVAPVFGSLGQVSIVYDPTYAGARPYEGPEIERVERLYDQLGDYGSVIKIEGEGWQPKVHELLRETHLCVIDISEVGAGVAWEIKTALSELLTDQIVLVASYDAAIQSEESLFDRVCQAVLSLKNENSESLEPEELRARLRTLRAPLLYGAFPLSALFRFRVYQLMKRLAAMRSASRGNPPVSNGGHRGTT